MTSAGEPTGMKISEMCPAPFRLLSGGKVFALGTSPMYEDDAAHSPPQSTATDRHGMQDLASVQPQSRMLCMLGDKNIVGNIVSYFK
jgi:hypothetical protein